MAIRAKNPSAKDNELYWIDQFCKIVQEGKTPASEVLEKLAESLSRAFSEIAEIEDGDKRRSEKTGKALAKNLGLLEKRGQSRESQSYEEWEHKVRIALEFEDAVERVGREEAKHEIAEKYELDERTIERYYEIHKNDVDVERRLREAIRRVLGDVESHRNFQSALRKLKAEFPDS